MEPIDTITLKDACETPLWKMVWAGEPNRKIAVYMTYDDLMRLCVVFNELKGAEQEDEE